MKVTLGKSRNSGGSYHTAEDGGTQWELGREQTKGGP